MVVENFNISLISVFSSVFDQAFVQNSSSL